jgi:hypothetical protein
MLKQKQISSFWLQCKKQKSLDFLVQGVALQVGVVFLQDEPFGCVLFVFGRAVPRNRFSFFFGFSALERYNDSVFFSFGHDSLPGM